MKISGNGKDLLSDQIFRIFKSSVLGELWECLGSVLRVPLVSRTSMASLKPGVSCELLSNAKEFKLQILGNA